MCGLVGLMTTSVASDRHMNLLQNLLFVDRVRGEHATGVAKVHIAKNEVEVLKKAVSASIFLGMEEAQTFFKEDRGRIYIGHNRYATLGDKTKHDNAHPFQEGHITMVHNGGVDSWTLDRLEGHDELEVDSHMVCRTIAKHGIEAAIGKLSGAFALIWWDAEKRSLNFIRNNDRPLWLAELTDGTVVWASEREFLDFFVLHKKSPFAYKVKPLELPVNTLLTYNFTETGAIIGGKPTTKKLTFVKVPDPNPTPARNYYWPSGYGRSQGSMHAADARANAQLAFWGLDARVDDFIDFKVERLEDCQNNKDRVNVYGEYEGVDVLAYYIPRQQVEGHKILTAKITNAYEATVRRGVGNVTELRISVAAAGMKPRVTETESKKEGAVLVLNPFPLKVFGHTFMSREEFVDFASNGCEMCGQIPTVHNKLNKHMSVYAADTDSGKAPGSLNECVYICGECVNESFNEHRGAMNE